VLAEKVERLLVDSMTWKDGRFYFDDEGTTRLRAAVSTAFDLAGLLAGGSQWPGRKDADAVPVSDADVLEVRPLTERTPSNDAGPAPRRRKRGAA
jgi:hypothetical protein